LGWARFFSLAEVCHHRNYAVERPIAELFGGAAIAKFYLYGAQCDTHRGIRAGSTSCRTHAFAI
jgi:hypothetical protein